MTVITAVKYYGGQFQAKRLFIIINWVAYRIL